MKKSFSVNISGIIFQIDEDAYEKLNRYLDRLNMHFAGTEGKDEIIADIEQRIAEMLTARLGESHRVVTLFQIEEIIRTLGEPADFDDNIKEPPIGSRQYRKRLYRDSDDKVLGGIAGGLGAYFNTDPLWFRIIFIALTIFGGSGIIIYLVLWLIVPEARTTAERLEMRGEEININNIERTIKEEMHDIRNRFGNWKKGDGFRKKKDNATRIAETSGQIFVTLFTLFFKFIAGIIGFAIVMTGIALLIAIFVPGFSFHGFPVLYDVSIHEFLTMLTGTPGIAWLFLIAFLVIILIPLFGILWGGIRLLFGIKRGSRAIGAMLTGIWILAIMCCTVITIINVNDFSKKGFETTSRSWLPTAGDTLTIGFQPGDSYRWIDEEDEPHYFRSVMIEEEEGSLMMIGKPEIEFRESYNDSVKVIVTRRARGKSHREADSRAQEIHLSIHQDQQQLLIDQHFRTPAGAFFRDQQVKINIYIPKNMVFALNPLMQQHSSQISNFDPLWDEQLPKQFLTMRDQKLIVAGAAEKPL